MILCLRLADEPILLSELVVVFFFFKQKTADEGRISDWSSDVCSSDCADRALANAGLPRVTRDAADQAFGPGAERWLSDGAWLSVRDAIKADPALLGRRAVIDVPASTDIDSAAKGDPSPAAAAALAKLRGADAVHTGRSEEHTSELQSLMRNSYDV